MCCLATVRMAASCAHFNRKKMNAVEMFVGKLRVEKTLLDIFLTGPRSKAQMPANGCICVCYICLVCLGMEETWNRKSKEL